MRRLFLVLSIFALAAAFLAPSADAQFGLSEFKVSFANESGEPVTQAGSHPFAMTTAVHFISVAENVEEAAKDLVLTQPKGFVGNPTATLTCPTNEFLAGVTSCPDGSAVGFVSIRLAASGGGGGSTFAPVYNLEAPPGKASKLGFWAINVPVTIELGVASTSPYNIVGGPTNISQVVEVVSASLTLWGVPALSAHDGERGKCMGSLGPLGGKCPAGISPVPFLTMPRSCEGPLVTSYATDSWKHQGGLLPDGFPNLEDPNWVTGENETTDSAGNPIGLTGCGKLGFGPEVSTAPTTSSAESASGLEIGIDVEDEGIHNPASSATANADIEAMEMRLPKGVTANPSAAEGQGVCSEAQFEAATLTNQGCPSGSKLGSLEVTTPILESHTLRGSVYLAEPFENPFGSLLAAYLVIRDEELGVFVTLPAEVETDEATGQLVTVVENMPPFPLEHVRVKLRSGARAPFVTPPTCGIYETETILYPSSGGEPLETPSTFQITSGPGGAPCPTSSPFSPGFEAGALSSAAGRYSPFSMRISRKDGEQDITRFSATLPPGEVARLAGVQQCSDSAIEAAKLKSGKAELASPSCPAGSKIGEVVAGAGVGSDLTYVNGSLYLAGPYNGSQVSVAAIVPAVAGPFDVGTVVTRVGLKLNPETGEGEVDGAASDPIPHILKGIPLKLRDLRVYANRPGFTLNPTSCNVFSTTGVFSGSGLDPFSSADDTTATASSRYQASSCASLRFGPSLKIQLKGGTRRNDHPTLHSVVTYPKGSDYANIGRAVVILPHSEFIDPERVGIPCTRPAFAENKCPKGSLLGFARAYTPLLEKPLEGPVYFRTNGGVRKTPDIVADLNGQFHVVLVGGVDSVDPKAAKIRTTFAQVPDAPVSRFELDLKGGKEGVIVNSANLCRAKRYVQVKFKAQNGRLLEASPPLQVPGCKKKSGKG